MSKIKFQGDSGGTGVFTIASPNSSNDRTITLPDSGGTLVDTGLSSTASLGFVIDEDNMASDLATKVPTQQSVKAYVDAQIAAENTLAEDNDVNITSAADGSMLLYDTGTSMWIDNVMSGDATMTDGGVISLAANTVDSSELVDGSIDTSHIADAQVTLAKIASQAANTVLVRDANSSGVVSAKAVANTELLIGNNAGFTAAALSGDVTMTNAGVVTISADAVDSAEIADGAIDLAHMSANSVDSDQYVDGSIDTVHIADSQITSAKIADGTIATADVADAAITTAKIAADNINGTLIADDSIDSEHIAAGALDTEHYAAGSVDAAALATNSVDSAELIDGAVDLSHMSVNSVDSDQYVDGSIDRVHLSADIIDGTKIADDAVDSEHLAADSIDAEHYAPGSVDTTALGADAVTADKIGDDVVNSEHIAAGAIDLEHMSVNSIDSNQYVDGSIDTAHIADSQITLAKMAANSVDSDQYVDGSVDNVHLAGSIANAKLANSSITVTDGSNSTAMALGSTVTFSATANETTVAENNGTITIGLPDNVTIAGNLTVVGTQSSLSSTTIEVADPLVALATNNGSADSVDIGIYGLYDTSGSQDLYSGLFRDASDSGKWKLFKDNQAEPTTTVNTGGTGYAVGTLVANVEGEITGNAATATKLATARAFTTTGDVVLASANFDGSANFTTTATIQSGSVETSMIAADAITGAKIADDAINSEHYTDGSIDTAHLADGQVTTAKLATAVFTGATDIGAAIADADLFLMDDGAGGTIRKTAASRIKTYAGGLAGVTTDSGNVTITDGNLTFGGAGHGVHLGVTSATAANLLDDYEEGTWTPVMTTAAGSLSGVTYGAYNLGWYTKVGRNVTINFNVHLNSKGSGGSGAVRMSGYPFSGTTLLTASVYGSLYMYNGGVDQPCCTYGTWQNHQTIRYVNAGTGGEITWANISNGSSWSGMMTYITNQ